MLGLGGIRVEMSYLREKFISFWVAVACRYYVGDVGRPAPCPHKRAKHKLPPVEPVRGDGSFWWTVRPRISQRKIGNELNNLLPYEQ